MRGEGCGGEGEGEGEGESEGESEGEGEGEGESAVSGQWWSGDSLPGLALSARCKSKPLMWSTLSTDTYKWDRQMDR